VDTRVSRAPAPARQDGGALAIALLGRRRARTAPLPLRDLPPPPPPGGGGGGGGGGEAGGSGDPSGSAGAPAATRVGRPVVG
jgi:hypothetical protein